MKIYKTILHKLPLLVACSFILSSCGGGSSSSGSNNYAKPSGVIFGNNAGIVYANNKVLNGNGQVSTIDSNQIVGIASDNNNLYAATNSDKVYQYNQSTSQWVSMPGNGAGGTLDAVAIYDGGCTVFTMNNGILYAGTTNGNVFIYSDDQWSRIGNNINTTVQSITFDQNNVPYIGSSNGNVYKYESGIWNNLQLDIGSQINALAFYNGNLYAGTSSGDVQEYSNGVWNSVSSFANISSVNTLASFNGELYAGVTNSDTSGTIYTYDGSNWNGNNSPDDTPVNTILTKNNNLYMATNGNPNGQVFIYNGGSWTQISALTNGQTTALTVNGTDYYVGAQNPLANTNQNTQGLFHYTQGMSTWQAVGGSNAVDSSSIVLSTATDNNGNFYAGTIYNVYKYNTTLSLWLPLATNILADFSGVSSISTSGNTVYFTTFTGNVYYANGSSWQQIGSQLTANGSNLYSATDSKGNFYVAVSNASTDSSNYGLVYQCNKNINDCQLMSGSNSNGSLDNSQIQSLATDNLGNLYAGTSIGLVWKYPVGGSAWRLLGPGTPDYGQVNSIAINSNNDLTIGTNVGHVYKYNGANWLPLGIGALDNGSAINTVTYDSNGVLHALTAGGNLWQYLPNNSLWINENYGAGIVIGGSPTASGY